MKFIDWSQKHGPAKPDSPKLSYAEFALFSVDYRIGYFIMQLRSVRKNSLLTLIIQ
ncbi:MULTISPECIES: hypothetical protein [Leptospira]|uniref:hypothetical protein n=1 Tax=Leptospira TaxID=171 RepID=UPI000AD207AE|nr:MULTISPECIES: hypothetical protein [Leptospira]